MNWVGGSRSRVVMKSDAKRQREFFEKRKMQRRLKSLGLAAPASPPGTGSASLDLVTLFIVNQIAARKENKDPPKVAVLGSCKGGSKHKRNEPLVLPMSPCSPSQLSLVEGQHLHSVQVTTKRKHVISHGFKCPQLSPVLESALSDNSACDYLPPLTNPLSPFSSASSASSGQGGVAKYFIKQTLVNVITQWYLCIFYLLSVNLGQIKLFSSGLLRSHTQAQLPPHRSPPPWDPSGLEQTKFQPFSQPRAMADSIPWSCGSNPPVYQLETPTAAEVLFGGPVSANTEARDHAGHEVTFSLNQPEDRELVLDFTLNQSEAEQHFEEDVFRGFSTKECEREDSHFGRGKSKIYLKDGRTSTPQTVPNTQCMGVELSNTDMNFSCLEHNNGPMNGCECSPSYSCRSGYLSSDTNDEDECCEPCLQAASSYMDQACCADSLNPNLGSQGNPDQKHTQPRLLTPLLKPQINLQDNQKVMENVVLPDKALGSNSQQTGRNAVHFAFPQALAQTQSSELCKCKKTSSETREAGTQTVDNPAAETCDASTQCVFVVDRADTATGFSWCSPPVDVSVQRPATGRQTDTAAEPDTHTPSSGKEGSGGQHTPWSKNKLSGSSVLNKFTAAYNSDGKVIRQGPINPFLGALSFADGRGKETREGRDERGQKENGRVMKDLSTEVREEVTSATSVNRLSEDAKTLQEIADILLLLKQRKREG